MNIENKRTIDLRDYQPDFVWEFAKSITPRLRGLRPEKMYLAMSQIETALKNAREVKKHDAD